MADRRCVMCNFVTADQNLMKRHVAISHGKSAYSTLQCGVCNRKFYDLDHFVDHVRETPSCLSIIPAPLTEQEEKAFDSLVQQMMTPVQAQFAPFQSIGSSAIEKFANGESTSQVKLRSNCPFADWNMEVNGNSATPKTTSVKSSPEIGHSPTRNTGNRVQGMKLTKTIGRVSIGPKIIKRPVIDQKKPRQSVASGKQGGLILKRNSLGKKFGTTGASKLSKSLRESVSTSTNGTDGRQNNSMEPGRKTIPPPHIAEARVSCYKKVQKFMENGKLYCQLCSKWKVVEYPSKQGVGYVMDTAIRHVTTHMEKCHLFECSKCHITSMNKRSMYGHVKNCRKGGRAKIIDRTNQYYQEILVQFLVCFDQAKCGDGLEQLATKSMDTGQGSQLTGGGNGSGQEDEKMEEAGSSFEPMETNSVCSKCSYKTANQMLFRRHQMVMHKE